MKKIIIAIDGLSSCGKSTMAKQLAKNIEYIYVDTGAMYRAVTLYSIQNNLISKGEIINKLELQKALPNISINFKLNNHSLSPETYLNGINVERKIRSMEVSNNVSHIAKLDFVREEMVRQQQAMGVEKGIVMDGRDIGTTVFPNAELKFFIQASAEVRAKRRYDELVHKKMKADYEEILKNLTERDEIDKNRSISPLRPAKDAIILDNSNLTIEEQDLFLLKEFNEKIASLS